MLNTTVCTTHSLYGPYLNWIDLEAPPNTARKQAAVVVWAKTVLPCNLVAQLAVKELSIVLY